MIGPPKVIIIGDGDALVPLLDMDCSHDINAPLAMSHAIMPFTCFDLPPVHDERDHKYVMTRSCDAMLHRISCDNFVCDIMFATPQSLSCAMNEISDIKSLSSFSSDYVISIKMNLICEYGIDDKFLVSGICICCANIAMLPLHNLRNSSHIPYHDRLALNMQF